MNILKLVPLLAVANIERALELYEDILGLRVTGRHEEGGSLVWCSAKAGASEVMFQRHPALAGKNGGVVLYVYCDDVDALRERLVADGWNVTEAGTEDGRRECEFVDADGHVVMLCEQREAATRAV